MAQQQTKTTAAAQPLECTTLAEQETPTTADDWFVRSRWASHCYIFQARAVRIGIDGVRTLSLSHDITDGVEREVARFLDGPPTVHEQRSGIARLGAGEDSVPLQGRARHLEEFYRLSLAGESRIANRHAIRLEIEPLDDQRYGRRLWLDSSTALPLKQVLVDDQGRAVETFQLTALRSPQLYRGEIKRMSRQDIAAERSWRPEWLPGGFEPQAIEPTGNDVEQRVYGDGLTTLSLFVEPVAGQELLKPGIHRLGVSHAAVRHRELGGRTRQVVVMGELPPSVLQRVAESVRWYDEQKTAETSPTRSSSQARESAADSIVVSESAAMSHDASTSGNVSAANNPSRPHDAAASQSTSDH